MECRFLYDMILADCRDELKRGSHTVWWKKTRVNLRRLVLYKGFKNQISKNAQGYHSMMRVSSEYEQQLRVKMCTHPLPYLMCVHSYHKLIKRKNGKLRSSLIIWLSFFLFLQTRPNIFPFCLPGPSWTFLLLQTQYLQYLKVINFTIVGF